MNTPQIQYTDKEFLALLAALKQKIPFYLPEWTDHNDSDFGIVLLQLFSHVADILHFYLDRMLNEAFLPTVYRRENLINLLKLIDYKLSGAVPASVDLTFTLGQIYADDVTVPTGTECQSLGDETIYYETTEDLVIADGELSGEVGAVEGKSGDETLGTSDGSAYQKFAINASPIIDGTLQVFVAGEQWTEVDSLALSEAAAKEYYTQRDADEKITVFFGDDSQGKIPNKDAEIICKYRVGGGTRGNLRPNTITVINDSILHQGVPIAISVTNSQAASGGTDRETAAHAKVQAPLELRALNRCVTEDDYETLARSYQGVARAKCAPIESKNYRNIDLFIVPTGGGVPSEALKTGLQSFLDDKRMVLDLLTVRDPQYVTIDIEGTVHIKDTYVRAVVEAAVVESLNTAFAYDSDNVDFGKSLYLSDLYRLIDEIEGVDHVDLGAGMANIVLASHEFPQLGAVNLTFVGGA